MDLSNHLAASPRWVRQRWMAASSWRDSICWLRTRGREREWRKATSNWRRSGWRGRKERVRVRLEKGCEPERKAKEEAGRLRYEQRKVRRKLGDVCVSPATGPRRHYGRREESCSGTHDSPVDFSSMLSSARWRDDTCSREGRRSEQVEALVAPRIGRLGQM
ncbi:hypothetical protein M407DRAFT_185549 [Tulasnella calospora MUT 4182]|uniref:Uncharacterized protein n=1 Tax=Tulasnella calospora MUT 4182 TaxID=1051891 RepID=A0A0C3QKS1_9AGAM|nr:hypothetical protein M407DRAFT_185549 [Tulasnella calospora MUT 4182]